MVARTSNYFCLPVGLALLASSLSALAVDSDNQPFTPFVTGTQTYYSNLFNVPDGTPAGTPYDADPKRSDTAREADAGILFDTVYGQQQFNGQAKFSKTEFEHFTAMDNTGHDLLLNWNWKISNFMEGTLGATGLRQLLPFTDFHEQLRNMQDDNKQYATGDIKIAPTWRVHTGLRHEDLSYDLPINQVMNFTSSIEEAGLDFLSADTSSTGVMLRHINGNYPNYTYIDGQKADNTFLQNEFDVRFDWHLTPITELVFVGGYVRRTSDVLSTLNIFGGNGKLDLNWVPTRKLHFTWSAWRLYAPIQTGEIGYAINDGTSLDAAWDLTSKLEFSGNIRYEKQQIYEFTNAVVTPFYDQATNNVTLSAKYSPLRFLDITLAGFHNLRSATIVDVGYLGNGGSLSATFKF